MMTLSLAYKLANWRAQGYPLSLLGAVRSACGSHWRLLPRSLLQCAHQLALSSGHSKLYTSQALLVCLFANRKVADCLQAKAQAGEF